jgi:uncharacterized protein
MDVTPLIRSGTQVIQSYAGGEFRVSGVVYRGAIIVTAERTVSWEGVSSFPELRALDFRPLTLALSPKGGGEFDVVLLGTGKMMQLLNPALRRELKELGLAVDVMDTGAASRTYNVLMAEGRRVAAALLPSI